MHIYLPIAELSVNVFLVIGLGWITGVFSGLFGVGGGFLITPFLMFMGVPPAVSVATAANQIIASSASGFMNHARKNNVDFKMGGYLLIGGFVGSSLGIILFRALQRAGNIDLVISICYVVFLGTIGIMMGRESLQSIRHAGKKSVAKPAQIRWWNRLPWHTDFPHSKLHISRWLPIGVGFAVGIMVSLMGVGGGFFLVPAMIYILGMPTSVVIGTSLFQIMFISANVTLLHALSTQTVDILLAFMLLLGAVHGAQAGSRWGNKLPAEHLRGLLAVLVLAIALKLAFGLVTPPDNVFSVSMADD